MPAIQAQSNISSHPWPGAELHPPGGVTQVFLLRSYCMTDILAFCPVMDGGEFLFF